ncbi:MAG: hypothetical protein VW455_00560 [Nitrospinota bacterium]
MRSILRCVIVACFVFYSPFFQMSVAKAAEPPVVILVDGFGDCCANRMHRLIDGLRIMDVEFPALKARGLKGDIYSDYTVPWNSFSGMDQGFNVDLNPQSHVQQAI